MKRKSDATLKTGFHSEENGKPLQSFQMGCGMIGHILQQPS